MVFNRAADLVNSREADLGTVRRLGVSGALGAVIDDVDCERSRRTEDAKFGAD